MIRFRKIALAAAFGAAACLVWAREFPPLFAADIPASSAKSIKEGQALEDHGKILYYRNPMGLADTSPVPKKDPMGMDYIPVYEDKKAEGDIVRLTPERIQKMGVQTALVQYRDLKQTVHAVGLIQFDEAKQSAVAPRFDGWIEKLDVNTTGQKVRKGEALLTFYSPQLVQIENEYLVSITDNSDTKNDQGNGSLEKLRTFAVPSEEIQRLQREKTVNNSIVLRAPLSGTVLEKQAVEGMKFSAGDILYRLTDLSDIWVIAQVYEQDLAKIKTGEVATVTVSAYPEHSFVGKVAFIYPDINQETRTAKVRLSLSNKDDELRLGMFADVKIDSTAFSGLSIPVAAVLDSGKQKSVLVDLGEGRFRSQLVKLGQRDDDFIHVINGLKEGESVVKNASFLIDAESNIRSSLQNFSAAEK